MGLGSTENINKLKITTLSVNLLHTIMYLDAKHRYSLFNARVPSKDLPVRFSICSIEKTLEEMRSLARSSYN